MKKIRTGICFALFILSATTLTAQSDAKEQLVVPLSNPGKPYSLEVSLLTGSIEVSSYAGKDIIIDVTAPDGKRKDAPEKDSIGGMMRIMTRSGYDLTATEKDNQVIVHNGLERTIHLSLKIPQDVKLKLHTVNNGAINVDNLRGQLEITDVNGSIRLTGISGSVVANTINGDIFTSFVAVDPQAPMAFSTLNGNIDVSFPADTRSNLQLKSDRGNMFSDFEIAIDPNEAKPKRSSESGMFVVKLEDWVYGKINGGGVNIVMKNMNGNIYIRKAK